MRCTRQCLVFAFALVIWLQGAAAAAIPMLEIIPSSHDFGEVAIGDSAVFAFDVFNIGDMAAEDVDAAVGGVGFLLLGGPDPFIPEGGASPVVVQFAPEQLGLSVGVLDVNYSFGAALASLSGIGTPEPGTGVLVGLGLTLLASMSRGRRSRRAAGRLTITSS